MLEADYVQIEILIKEAFGYMGIYDKFLKKNEKIAKDDTVIYRFEFVDSMLSDLIFSLRTTSENSRIFIFCSASLRCLHYLKHIGVIEYWIDLFQAVILDIAMISNIEYSHKKAIQTIYLKRLI